MHNDEVVWQILGNNFCSYKAKLLTDTFCRNPYNVTGLCNKVSCPLSNGYYATVTEENGLCYLCLKTIERAHLPRSMWEKIELSSNYQKALEQIDTHMKNVYKDHQIHRCKQRLTRLRQTLIRMRQTQLQPDQNLVPVKKKTERREAVREQKAKTAAKLEISIEQELLNRLKEGVYGDIYNYDRQAFERILQDKEEADELNRKESELEMSDPTDTFFVEEDSDSNITLDEDNEDISEDDDKESTGSVIYQSATTITPDVEELHKGYESKPFQKRVGEPLTDTTHVRRRKLSSVSTRYHLLNTSANNSFKESTCPRVEVEYEREIEPSMMEE